jgi:UDP-2,4-diacetamido-2,4,6-trideoxy-beta-L-altropyranose hydrolase
MTPTTLLIRADATTKIGTGHLMRCLALAQAWQDFGGRITFLSNCDNDALRRRIIDEGFNFIPIEKSHPDPLDLSVTLENLSPMKNNPLVNQWLVIDGYHFTPAYQKVLKDSGCRLFVFDDYNHLPYYHADILLNQNIHAKKKYSCDPDTVQLLGCKYALLRREFLKYKDWQRVLPQKANKLLISFGGADTHNVTLKVLKGLNQLNDKALDVKIVVGPSNRNIESLQKELDRSIFSFELLTFVKDMASIMAWADVAVSAAGSTCWELAFMRLPCLIITVAENQVGIAEDLQKAGAAIHLGWHNEIKTYQIAQILQEFLTNIEKMGNISENGHRLVDGKGGKRTLRSILVGKMKLRLVKEEDCELLWQWFNDPQTRAASFHSDTIKWEEHCRWFTEKIKSSDCIIYLVSNNQNKPFGQVRFEVRKNTAVISLNVAKEFRGIGASSKMIKRACTKFCSERKIKSVRALIKKENMISISAFRKAGFEETAQIEHLSFPAIVMEYKKKK